MPASVHIQVIQLFNGSAGRLQNRQATKLYSRFFRQLHTSISAGGTAISGSPMH